MKSQGMSTSLYKNLFRNIPKSFAVLVGISAKSRQNMGREIIEFKEEALLFEGGSRSYLEGLKSNAHALT